MAVVPCRWSIIGGHEAEAVVRLAEAGVIAAAEELIDGLGVAVGGEDVEQLVEAHAERVDLAVREVLDAAAVELEAEDVARLSCGFRGRPCLSRGCRC